MRTTAAGLYPAGAAPCGALDMAGNAWEWCLNKYEKVEEVAIGGEDTRVLRGGSWFNGQLDCRAAYRDGDLPFTRSIDIGYRLCLSSPIEDD
jgi:formylglycine-generating enzyme required for sulfatase activity